MLDNILEVPMSFPLHRAALVSSEQGDREPPHHYLDVLGSMGGFCRPMKSLDYTDGFP